MRPEAHAAMVEVLERAPGNPSGQHRVAREARRLLDDARDVVADVLGARPGEIVFTSGGTEADNLAITGSVSATGGRPICLATDHHAVLHPVLAAGGETVAVDRLGVVDLDDLARRVGRAGDADGSGDGDRADRGAGPVPCVVSLALANNEVGTMQPVAEVAEVLRRLAPDAVLHLDAVAAVAWTDVARLAAPARLISV
ncbi:MAG: putative cysteine desulfurase, partial [Acidimicrobiales bacterium]|nr:putative cysteine desulfurase [Acidimicrobiales bacterium]